MYKEYFKDLEDFCKKLNADFPDIVEMAWDGKPSSHQMWEALKEVIENDERMWQFWISDEKVQNKNKIIIIIFAEHKMAINFIFFTKKSIDLIDPSERVNLKNFDFSIFGK